MNRTQVWLGHKTNLLYRLDSYLCKLLYYWPLKCRVSNIIIYYLIKTFNDVLYVQEFKRKICMWTDLTNSTNISSDHAFHQKVLKPVSFTYYLSRLCLYVFRKGIHLSANYLTCPSHYLLIFRPRISVFCILSFCHILHIIRWSRKYVGTWRKYKYSYLLTYLLHGTESFLRS